MHRPTIGICAQLVNATWGSWDKPAVLLSHSYLDAIAQAGALGLMIPPDPALADDPRARRDRKRARPPRGRARHAPARDLPRHAGAQRRLRRHPAATRARG